MITMIKLVCPACGANLEVGNKLSQCFCQYCGAKILLHNENEFVDRIVDEAKLEEQNTEKERIEFERHKLLAQQSERKDAGKELVAFVLGIAYIALGIMLIISIVHEIQSGRISDYIIAGLGMVCIILSGLGTFSFFAEKKRKSGLLMMLIGLILGIICIAEGLE